MAFTNAITVATGNAILAATTNNLAANTEFNRGLADVQHNFDISTGTGYHKGDWRHPWIIVNDDANAYGQLWMDKTDTANILLRVKTATTKAACNPTSMMDGVVIAVGINS